MKHVLISGEVQGVGFRQFIKYQAKKLNITGWIKNLPDGKVEGMLSGEQKNLEVLLKYCKRGPYLAEVKDIKIDEIPDQKFEIFEIIKD